MLQHDEGLDGSSRTLRVGPRGGAFDLSGDGELVQYLIHIVWVPGIADPADEHAGSVFGLRGEVVVAPAAKDFLLERRGGRLAEEVSGLPILQDLEGSSGVAVEAPVVGFVPSAVVQHGKALLKFFARLLRLDHQHPLREDVVLDHRVDGREVVLRRSVARTAEK